MPTFDLPTANSPEALQNIISSDEHGPSETTLTAAKRLCSIAQERTRNRSERPMEGDKDYVFTSTWINMLSDKLGEHNGSVNMYAIGTIDMGRSAGKNAYYSPDAVVPQIEWLHGNDAATKMLEVDTTDDDGPTTATGEMWWPSQYTLVVELADDLVHEEPNVTDLM